MKDFEKFTGDRDLLIQIIRNQAKIAHYMEHLGRKIDVCMRALTTDQGTVGNEHLQDVLTVMLDEDENLFGAIYKKAERLREEE